MAASVAATMAVASGVGSVVAVRNGSGLSSSSSFGAPLVRVAPIRPAAMRNVVIARASLPEEQQSGKAARREMLAGLMAAGAALAAAGSAMAASGPGTSGAERTSQKADELLKAADDLTNEDSPPRFAPGRVEDTSNAGQLAQQAGSGAVEEIQGGTTGAVEGAKKTADETKDRFNLGSIFGSKDNTSVDLGDVSPVGDVAGKVSSDLDVTSGKVKSDVATTSDKVEKLQSDAGDVLGLVSKIDGTKDQVGSVVADAQTKVENTAEGAKSGKSIIDTLLSKFQNVIPQ